MGRRRAGKSRDQSREETRQGLLEAGYALLQEAPVGDVLSQVKAQEVATRAGVSSGAVYYHWDDQEAYREELLDHSFTVDHAQLKQVIEGAVQEAKEQGAEFEEIVRAGAVADFEQIKHRTSLPVLLALWGKHRTDAAVRERLRERYHELDKQLIPLYDQILSENNLKIRSPFTVAMFAATMTALIEGMLIRWAVDPQAVPDKLAPSSEPPDAELDKGPWNLFAVAVLALVPCMTAPIDARHDGPGFINDKDTRQLVRSLRKAYGQATTTQ
jgi:AcrR family transcriptional regulator